MRKIFYTSFNFWRKLDEETKKKYFPIAISYTVPSKYDGPVYGKLVPSDELFGDTHRNGYEERRYFLKYAEEISRYGKELILKEIREMTDLIPVLLGWEEYKVVGECQFVTAWLYGIGMEDALSFELSVNLFPEEENEFFKL